MLEAINRVGVGVGARFAAVLVEAVRSIQMNAAAQRTRLLERRLARRRARASWRR